jgi:hypothetical protein
MDEPCRSSASSDCCVHSCYGSDADPLDAPVVRVESSMTIEVTSDDRSGSVIGTFGQVELDL